eukprot:comp12329_c0_seq1/m.7185 comp12329_c0_seq1/g.7185  ORF comp12329_c0_seq1/g.7185 comp12329_c0_seq1/m.7185 type:complete len:266 (-) comp12329_c0_seq1:952-1749(-)
MSFLGGASTIPPLSVHFPTMQMDSKFEVGEFLPGLDGDDIVNYELFDDAVINGDSIAAYFGESGQQNGEHKKADHRDAEEMMTVNPADVLGPHPSTLTGVTSCSELISVADDVPELDVDDGTHRSVQLPTHPPPPAPIKHEPAPMPRPPTSVSAQTPTRTPRHSLKAQPPLPPLPSTVLAAAGITKRKRRKGADDEGTRREKNRLSAKECRRRKKEYLEGLEGQLSDVIMENNQLKKAVAEEQKKNKALAKEAAELKRQVKTLKG